MNESNDMTRKQDSEAFQKWFSEHGYEEINQLQAWLAACEYKDAQYLPRYEESEDAIYINGRKFYGEKVVKEYEADWLKMRDIAEETQRKLEEAIEVLRSIAFMDEPDADKVEYWMNPDLNKLPQTLAFDTFLAREFLEIEGKNDEPCNHQWQYFASGHALCLNCEETKKPVKFPPNKYEV